MSKLRLTLACGAYEIVRALIDKRVVPDGIDLEVLAGDRTRILKSKRRDECDMAEFNLIGFLMDRESDPGLVALPVYPHRRFRHGFIFTDPRRAITEPAGLTGQRVGILGERPAAAVWVRGILAEHYGLAQDAVEWVDGYGILGELPPVGAPGRSPSGVVEDRFLEGELAAIIAPSFPPSFLRGDSRVQRLFRDPKTEEIGYFEKTGIFPIMHAVVTRRELLDEHPWVASSMASAFEQAKQLAYERIRNPRVLPLAFFQHAWEEQRELLGADPWQYGLSAANRKNLETAIRYAHEQGLITSFPSVDEAFVELDESAFLGTPGF